MNGGHFPAWKSAMANATLRIPFTPGGEGSQMKSISVVAVLGIDLAKREFAVHGLDAASKAALKRVIAR